MEIRYYTYADLITTIQLEREQAKNIRTCSYCNFTTRFKYPVNYKYLINFGALTALCSETCFNILVLSLHAVSNNTELVDIMKTYKSVILSSNQYRTLNRKFKKCII